jgi:hypothetical protein
MPKKNLGKKPKERRKKVPRQESEPELEELNSIVLKYAMHLKKIAKKTTDDDFKRGEISVNSIMYYLGPIKNSQYRRM